MIGFDHRIHANGGRENRSVANVDISLTPEACERACETDP